MSDSSKGFTYIHYGSGAFDTKRFNPIKDRLGFVKPFGGLWASPIDSRNSWKDWCIANEFNLDALSTYFTFKLKPGTRVAMIKSRKDLEDLWIGGYVTIDGKYSRPNYLIKFEKLLKDGFDAVEVKLNDSLYWDLYGWDCDSILILNPDCMDIISEQDNKEEEIVMKTSNKTSTILKGVAVVGLVAAGCAIGYSLHRAKINHLLNVAYKATLAGGLVPVILNATDGRTMHALLSSEETALHEPIDDWDTYKF